MPDPTPAAAPVASSAPPSVTAEAAKLPATPPPIGEQSKPQEPPKPPEPPPVPEDLKSAAALAQAKRFAAKAQADREAAQRIQRESQEDRELAKQTRELQAIYARDKLEFAEKVGIDPYELSKLKLAKTTGTGKSPADLVKEEVARARAEDAQKYQEEQLKAQQAERIRVERQTLEGAKRQLETLINANKADRYEVLARNSKELVEPAWVKIEEHFAKTKEVLGFDQALDQCESDVINAAKDVLTNTNKGKAVLAELIKAQKEAAEAALKAKAPTLSAKPSRVERSHVVETEKPSPTPNPTRRTRQLDYSQMAKQLWEEHKAKSDN